ncbi:hypothetical protein BGZ60DRAFT_400172 [Tricladium varicosporioides]|nr:hypothetical protein BGZ60DRAFT_400172 [Hymenoscyphus varicosporioides]
MSQPIRDTQRVPRSCTACSRKKIRCSKTIPCVACVRKGDAQSCEREIVRVNGKPTVAIDSAPVKIGGRGDLQTRCTELENENKGLQARIQHLEAIIKQGDLPQSDFIANYTPTQNISSHRSDSDEILTVFHDLHVESHPKSLQVEFLGKGILRHDYIFSILPIRKFSDKIVHFSLQELGWIHCSLNAPIFLAQHDKFWDSWNAGDSTVLENHNWMALYLSILCVGVYFMPPSDTAGAHFLHEGLSGSRARGYSTAIEEAQNVCRTWYEAVFKELNFADFIGKPTLPTVQTLAILNLVHRNFGESEREYVLLGVAINISRAIHMDRLGSEALYLNNSQRLQAMKIWRSRDDREIGRRLWWTLLICDWMMMPIRPCLIAAGSFSTCLSVEDDSTHREIIIDSKYLDEQNYHSAPSPLLYHIFAANLASIVRPYRDSNKRTSATSAWKTLQALQLLEASLPMHLSKSLSEDMTIGCMQSSWLSTQRSLCIDLLLICRVNICLAALPEILESKQDLYDLKRHGRQAATTLIDHRRHISTPYFVKLWGPRRSIFAAGIYLILDLICFAKEQTLQEVQEQVQRVGFVLQVLSVGFDQGQSQTQVLLKMLDIYNQLKNNDLEGKDDLFRVMDSIASPDRGVHNENYVAEESPGHSSTDSTHTHPDLVQLLDFHTWDNNGLNLPIDFNDFAFDIFSQPPSTTSWWLSSQLSGFTPPNGV